MPFGYHLFPFSHSSYFCHWLRDVPWAVPSEELSACPSPPEVSERPQAESRCLHRTYWHMLSLDAVGIWMGCPQYLLRYLTLTFYVFCQLGINFFLVLCGYQSSQLLNTSSCYEVPFPPKTNFHTLYVCFWALRFFLLICCFFFFFSNLLPIP